MAPPSTPPRLPRHERPGLFNDGSVLAAVNTASRRLWRWPPASVDRHCARRLPDLRPGRRNAVQPNKETVRSQLRRERRSTPTVFGQDRHLPSRSGVPAGTMDWVRPQCLQEELGLKPGNPAHLRLDRPFPLQTPSGGSPALTPYRSMPPAWIRRKKRVDFQGPVTEASIPLTKAMIRVIPSDAHECDFRRACRRHADAPQFQA